MLGNHPHLYSVKLKAVSADHCNIINENEKGWHISERGKEKQSLNGRIVFMKSHEQMNTHEHSDLIPVHDGMEPWPDKKTTYKPTKYANHHPILLGTHPSAALSET